MTIISIKKSIINGQFADISLQMSHKSVIDIIGKPDFEYHDEYRWIDIYGPMEITYQKEKVVVISLRMQKNSNKIGNSYLLNDYEEMRNMKISDFDFLLGMYEIPYKKNRIAEQLSDEFGFLLPDRNMSIHFTLDDDENTFSLYSIAWVYPN